jgi:hypothetical protein
MHLVRQLRISWRSLIVPGLLLVVSSVLVLNSGLTVRPHLSRQAVIQAVVSPAERHLYSRVAAKLIHRRELHLADPLMGDNGQPGQLVWVVAVSGNYGLAPSFGCCGGPADYHGRNTWGMVIIPDAPGPPVLNEFESDWHGDWPPFFDALPDLYIGL